MITEHFTVPAKLKTTGFALLVIGLLTLIIGGVTYLGSGVDLDRTRFWVSLLHNSVFFLFICVASIFIQAAVTLAQGSWILSYKRVPEAIGANVWIFGVLALTVLLAIVFGAADDSHGHNPIYHWTHPGDDVILQGKSPFLNSGMFVGFSVVSVLLWAYFGIQFRKKSIAMASTPKNSTKLYWGVIAMSGAFLFVYALSMMSTIPWFWIMSIDAHWFSTLFSWYVFASAFVSGVSLVLLWVVYLKNNNFLKLVSKEHIHDIGKFMFAFSIFWTYLWFSQFMLIWYGNIPEETTYFKIRMQGPYSFFFFANLVLNFVLPIFVLMSRPSKRNYFTLVFMAIIIIFGHWLDFYIMIMPSPMQENWHLGLFELGVPLFFVGLLILTVSKTLSKASLVTENHPLLKETFVHVS